MGKVRPGSRAPANTPAGQYRTRNSYNQARRESARGGEGPAAAERITDHFPQRRSRHSEPRAGPSHREDSPDPDEAMEDDIQEEPEAPPAEVAAGNNGGSSAGGTMVAGGMQTGSYIPSPLQLLNGQYNLERRYRIQIPILKEWPGFVYYRNGPDDATCTLKTLYWRGPYFYIPAELGGMYMNRGLASFLDEQMYWNVDNIGWKVDKVDFHRISRTPPNAETEVYHDQSAWQPSLFLLRRGAPPQFTLHSAVNANPNNKTALRVYSMWGNAEERLSPLASVGFCIDQRRGTPANTPTPPMWYGSPTETISTADSKTLDFLHHKCEQYNMSGKGPVVEMKPMKGWRIGHQKARQSMKAWDDLPSRQAEETEQAQCNGVGHNKSHPNFKPGGGAGINPTATNTDAVDYVQTNRRYRNLAQSPPAHLAHMYAVTGNRFSQFRSSKDQIYPHIGPEQEPMFLKFNRPPDEPATTETIWYATLEITTEIVGRYENCFATEDTIFANSDANPNYMGDRRKVMLQNMPFRTNSNFSEDVFELPWSAEGNASTPMTTQP